MKLMRTMFVIGLVISNAPINAMFNWWPFSGTTQQESQKIEKQKISLAKLSQLSMPCGQKSLLTTIGCGPTELSYALAVHPTKKSSAHINIADESFVQAGDHTVKMKSGFVFYQFLKYNKSGSLLAFKDEGEIRGATVKIYHPESKKITELPDKAHNFDWNINNLMAVNNRYEEVLIYNVDEKKLISEPKYVPQLLYKLDKCNFWWASFNPKGDILATMYGDDIVLRHSADGKKFARAKTKRWLESLDWNKEGTTAVGISSGHDELFLINSQGGVHQILLPKEKYRLGKIQDKFVPMRTFMHEYEEGEPCKVKIYNTQKRDYCAQLESKDGAYSVEINPAGTKFAVGKFKALELYDINGKLLAKQWTSGIVRTLCWNYDGSSLYALILGNLPGIASYAIKDDQLVCVNQMQMDSKKDVQKEETIRQ